MIINNTLFDAENAENCISKFFKFKIFLEKHALKAPSGNGSYGPLCFPQPPVLAPAAACKY